MEDYFLLYLTVLAVFGRSYSSECENITAAEGTSIVVALLSTIIGCSLSFSAVAFEAIEAILNFLAVY